MPWFAFRRRCLRRNARSAARNAKTRSSARIANAACGPSAHCTLRLNDSIPRKLMNIGSSAWQTIF
jgi:hypothetical protein